MSREEAAAGPLRVSAIAGTRVVLMALDIEPAGLDRFRGFAFQVSTDCPSADDLRLIRRFEKGGSGSPGLEFKRPAADAASGGLRWLYA